MESQVKKFYKDKCVFVTGATGLIGHLLIEKLLRCCDVKHIYILIRDKKNQTAQQRMDKMFDIELFTKLRNTRPDFRTKVIGITGDCGLDNLGLSASDRQELHQNVNIVFHVAAFLAANEPLTPLLRINVKGTRDIIDLCQEMQQLESFVYVSTAYSNCNRMEIEERFYEPATISGELSLELLESLGEEALNSLAPKICNGFPNTYCVSKHLAEDLIQARAPKFPVAIFRPAIIIQTYEEPIPGWTNNFFGPIGAFCQIATGTLRVIHTDKNMAFATVHADTCVSGLLAVAWEITQSSKESVKIYNFMHPEKNCIPQAEMFHTVKSVYREYPLSRAVWYPTFNAIENETLYKLAVFFYHYLPGVFFDTLLFLTRNRIRVIPIYNIFWKVNQAMRFFQFTPLRWSSDNVTNLWNKMETSDREWLSFDMMKMDLRKEFVESMKGMRYNIMKDKPQTLDVAKKRMKNLKTAHYFVTIFSNAFLVYFLYFLAQFILEKVKFWPAIYS